MTYRELIEKCKEIPDNESGCCNCKWSSECDVFCAKYGIVPSQYTDDHLDKEIEVKKWTI